MCPTMFSSRQSLILPPHLPKGKLCLPQHQQNGHTSSHFVSLFPSFTLDNGTTNLKNIIILFLQGTISALLMKLNSINRISAYAVDMDTVLVSWNKMMGHVASQATNLKNVSLFSILHQPTYLLCLTRSPI